MEIFKRILQFLVIFKRLSYTASQMVYGGWRITKLPGPIVTIFGSSRLGPHTSYAHMARILGTRLMQEGVSVLTGGGPGIMEAAICNTQVSGKGKGKSMGIGLKGLDEGWSVCAPDYFEINYFFARKWLLIQFSAGFIVFPGGFGTLDELAEVLTLMQTKSLKKSPLVLIGKEYWHPLVEWINKAVTQGAISEHELSYFHVTDDLDEAFCWVLEKCDAGESR